MGSVVRRTALAVEVRQHRGVRDGNEGRAAARGEGLRGEQTARETVECVVEGLAPGVVAAVEMGGVGGWRRMDLHGRGGGGGQLRGQEQEREQPGRPRGS